MAAAFQDSGFAFQGTGQFAFQTEIGGQVGPTPAGRPAKSRRKRYLVQIDGQDFEVDGTAEAVQLLERAKAVALRAAEQSVEREVKKSRRRKRAIRVYTPEITSSPEIAEAVSVYRDDIEAIYKRIAVDAEIRELMRLKMLEEDEDDALFVLLH